jgi:hypothetical protein
MTTSNNKRLIVILALVPLLLLVPLIAMQFTNEVNWDAFDFLIMGILLTATGLGCELALRKIKRPGYREIVVGIILLTFLLIWGELATGFFRRNLFGG